MSTFINCQVQILGSSFYTKYVGRFTCNICSQAFFPMSYFLQKNWLDPQIKHVLSGFEKMFNCLYIKIVQSMDNQYF